MIDQLTTDIRYGIRQVARAPLTTLVAGASVALGITVAVSAFSVLYGVFLKPLPLSDGDAIYHVYTSDYNGRAQPWGANSYLDYEDVARSGAFGSLTAHPDDNRVTVVA